MRTFSAVAIAAGLLATPPFSPRATASPPSIRDAAEPVAPPPDGASIATDSLLVRFERGTGDRLTRIQHAGAAFAGTQTPNGWLRVHTPEGRATDVHAELAGDPRVAEVTYEYRRSASYIPTDPLWGQQDDYLLPLRLDTAWDTTTALDITIAVIDTGVDPTHPDLAGRLVPGWDFLDGDNAPHDTHGHGTLVAGIAAATTGNGHGISGVAPRANIMPLKVLGNDGFGFDGDIAAAIQHAADSGADVINLSLGAPFNNPALADAVAYALARDVVVVAAAGNDGTAVPSYPAALPGVVAVGATGDNGMAAYFSNRGSWIDVAAPGVAIVGPIPGGVDEYGATTGTSVAAPIVAGVAALVRSVEPNFTYQQVVDRLQQTAKDRGRAGFDPVYGHGTVDAAAAVGALDKPTPATVVATGFGEPNGTAAQATPVNGSATGEIKPEGDHDWYAFNATPGTWKISVRPPVATDVLEPRRLDAVIDLYSPTGAHLVRRDATNANATETLSTSIATAGRYYVRVSNYLSSMSPGRYVLTLTPPPPVTVATTPAPSGYWMTDQGGTVYAFGTVPNFGGVAAAIVDLEPTPSNRGYWLVSSTGSVYTFGDAPYTGGVSPTQLAPGETITSMSRSASGAGYWLFTTLGRAFAFGDAPFLGDMSGIPLNGPVLDSVSTPSGRGYYMVASDGGVFAFGDAVFAGSMGGRPLNAPVQSLVPDGDGTGYWLVALDGGVFAFDAAFRGSMGGTPLNRPITGMVRFGNGYLMVGQDGGIFTFSDQPFFGSLGGNPPALPIVAVAAT